MKRIREGEYVVLFLRPNKKYLVRVKRGEVFHTHEGFIEHEKIIGLKYGDYVESSLGVRFYVFKPNLMDYLSKIKRRTQILYPKDIGLIILYAGVGPGSIIVEAGTGSGALTGILAYLVRPKGKVYSYELRSDLIEHAMRNLEILGVKDYVVIKNKDITKGIDEEGVDAVILDMATPWLVIPHARKALKGGGVFLSFSPTIEQAIRTVRELSKGGFIEIEMFESIIRKWRMVELGFRPETFMVGHTGFIVYARRCVELEEEN